MPDVSPVDAWMEVLQDEWRFSVWSCDLTIGENLIHLSEYNQASPPGEEYILCWNTGPGNNEDLGHSKAYKGRYGVATEIHSRRAAADEKSFQGLTEVKRIYGRRKLTIGNGYRKAWKIDNGEDITKHPVFKWLFRIELEEDLTLYDPVLDGGQPGTTFPSGNVIDGGVP